MCIFLKVGLGDGSALPVGVPVPWPLSIPPVGWLKCNGAAFSAAQYPKLAQVYPALVLPDLRGEFIRGWDDGRGIDAGRALLSAQAGMIERHEHKVHRRQDDSIVCQSPNADINGSEYLSIVHSRTVIPGGDVDTLYATPTGGSETRSRNIAFNYIVRAA